MSFRLAALVFACWAGFAVAIALAVVAVLDPQGETAPRRFSPPGQVEVLALGNSHATSFYFPALGLQGFSLHEQSSDLATAERKLRVAQDKLPGLKVVLVTYPPGWLEYDFRYRRRGGEAGALDLWALNMPFALRHMTLNDVQSRISGELRIFARASNLVKTRFSAFVNRGGEPPWKPAGDCRQPPNPPDTPDAFGIPRGYFHTPAPAKCLGKMAPKHVATVLRDVHATRRGEPEVREVNLARIARMAAIARSKGASLVLVTPPYTAEFFQPLARHAAWERQVADTRALAEQTAGLYFLDFHALFPPHRYRSHNVLFYDTNHLTRAGAAEFSRALKLRLEQLGVLGERRTERQMIPRAASGAKPASTSRSTGTAL